MQLGTKIAIGVGVTAGAVVAGGLAQAMLSARRDDIHDGPYTSPGDDPYAPSPTFPHDDGTSPGDDPIHAPYPPGGGTSPGDDPTRTRVSGHIDPPAWFDDYTFDGTLDRSRLDVTIDPRGWWNDIGVTGRVDAGGWNVKIDPPGWGNTVHVDGQRATSGWKGTVDRPGPWNDVEHRISESRSGRGVTREGRFDERLVPSFSEAKWRSSSAGGSARLLEFDPPGWGNTTRVTLDGNPPAGVEAVIAAHLFDAWKTELERQAEYPDPDYPDPTGPGDDYDYPTAPGDDYPTTPYDDLYPGSRYLL